MLTQQFFVDVGSNQFDSKRTCILFGLGLVVTLACANVHSVKVNFAKMLISAIINIPI